MQSEVSVSETSAPEMPEADIPENNFVPGQPLLNIGAGYMGTGVHSQIPENFISYRVTTESDDVVFNLFKGTCCVIATEVSKTGVQHYHVVVAGLEQQNLLKVRLRRAKLGVNKYWSKVNNGCFLKAVAYTIKCGDYKTRKSFHEFTDYVEEACPWVFGLTEHVAEASDGKDLDKDWMLTYNNLLRVAHNYAVKRKLASDDLGVVLQHMTENTRWIPSPQMMKAGLDPYYFKLYKFRVGTLVRAPDWWTPHSI